MLNREEKWELWHLRREKNQSSGWETFNIPEPGYTECTHCFSPQMMEGLCPDCYERLDYLENKNRVKRG
jgi:hypothetical protein